MSSIVIKISRSRVQYFSCCSIMFYCFSTKSTRPLSLSCCHCLYYYYFCKLALTYNTNMYIHIMLYSSTTNRHQTQLQYTYFLHLRSNFMHRITSLVSRICASMCCITSTSNISFFSSSNIWCTSSEWIFFRRWQFDCFLYSLCIAYIFSFNIFNSNW